jgi:hypothetical protein
MLLILGKVLTERGLVCPCLAEPAALLASSLDMDKKRFILKDADCLGAIYRLSERGWQQADWSHWDCQSLTVGGFFFSAAVAPHPPPNPQPSSQYIVN